MGWFIDTNGDGNYDTEVKTWGGEIVTQGLDNASHQKQNTDHTKVAAQIESVARSLAKTYGWSIGSSSSGASIGGKYDASHVQSSGVKGGSTEWGAQNITKDMFVKPDGTPKTVQEIYTTLDPILTGVTGDDLVNYINDILPQYTAVPEEEKGFLAKEREFAERGAGATREADIYGLQKEALSGSATPTSTGVGVREKISGMAGIKKEFGATHDAYSLAMEKAKFGEETGLYDLDVLAAGAFETDVVGSFDPTYFGDPGGTAETTPWETFMAREGGRVPSKSETFLDFLTKLPDAGGM